MSEEPAVARAESGWGVPGLRSQLDLMPREEPWRQQVYKTVQWELDNSQVSVVTWNPFIDTAPYQTAWTKYRKPYLEDEITLDEMLQGVEDEVNLAIQEGMDRAGV
jgi:multiple sugar transport system substrate-binding protein